MSIYIPTHIGCFELFTKIKKGYNDTSCQCIFSVYFFHKNFPY